MLPHISVVKATSATGQLQAVACTSVWQHYPLVWSLHKRCNVVNYKQKFIDSSVDTLTSQHRYVLTLMCNVHHHFTLPTTAKIHTPFEYFVSAHLAQGTKESGLCDKSVCLLVCLSVHMNISCRNHTSDMSYVLPVLRMTPCLTTTRPG